MKICKEVADRLMSVKEMLSANILAEAKFGQSRYLVLGEAATMIDVEYDDHSKIAVSANGDYYAINNAGEADRWLICFEEDGNYYIRPEAYFDSVQKIFIMPVDEHESFGQYIWRGANIVAVLSLNASLITNRGAQEWVNENYPFHPWEFGYPNGYKSDYDLYKIMISSNGDEREIAARQFLHNNPDATKLDGASLKWWILAKNILGQRWTTEETTSAEYQIVRDVHCCIQCSYAWSLEDAKANKEAWGDATILRRGEFLLDYEI